MEDRDIKKGTGAGAAVGAAAGGVAGGAAAGAAVGGVTGPVGAALGAAVGAGLGAVTGGTAAATDDGLSRDNGSIHTVIGAFDDASSAQRAVERLVQAGFQRDDVHLQHQQGSELTGQQREVDAPMKRRGFFASLFGMDDAEDRRVQQNPYAEHAYTYDEAVRRGSAVVVVDVQDEPQADQAAALLHELGAVDVDERSKQWRAEGWQPPQLGVQQNVARSDGQDKVLDVVEEQLQVGKRALDRGGVRVVQRVSSKPVRELIRLREEHAVVERRAVNRPATGEELSNFRESAVEVREMVEQPVVAKTARVVEEVVVGKEVREREEVVEDTVRRKDVVVERVAGQAGRDTARERAAAADESPLATRKSGGTDKPTL
ncbi:YsnF/AvaK domain-containing protein [Ramlibacter tataouinensis]|uniref:DUF2382 domain-containing protein n=1 Tax=Ramlibacter tataouinensis (strain ATCC BAA-407 / DSM 14655 / LMG 21543 / TTB310) TaxID=365046 RepID=F5XWV0_RAMTT|nr:YsnF/AvaK domain-containing protein [Ramlibacter tataouinensis]AEG91711.1 Conserved hypothetical protein [Ramlibacter tataouinensis TTB310]